MLLGILLAVLVVVCLALVSVILLQRSEGGALGMSGGGPGAFMTARGTGDLLTRTTQILAGLFFALCLGMALISGHSRSSASLVDKLKLNALTAPTSSAPPISSAAPLPAGLLNPNAPMGSAPPAPPLGAPQPGAPTPGGSSLNLLGAPQAPLAAAPTPAPRRSAPQAAVKPASTAKVAKVKPPTARPETNAATPAPPPSVTPAPLSVPPPPPPPAKPGATGAPIAGQ